MRRDKLNLKLISLFLLTFTMLTLVACSGGSNVDTVSDSKISESVGPVDPMEGMVSAREEVSKHLFLVVAVDTTTQEMLLKDDESGRQFLYYYNLSTDFYDKYGSFISVTSFTPGTYCQILKADRRSVVEEIKLSDKVWIYEDVRDYEYDPQMEALIIKGDYYHCSMDTPVFSNGMQVDFGELSLNDTLRVYGIEKEVRSLTVTTGHGYLNITGTESFDGTIICIGDIYTMLNGSMAVDLPEGEYNIVAAKGGYAATATVNVERGLISELNLESIKTSEMQYCMLTFNIEVPNAEIKVDGKKVNINEQFSVLYGQHTLSVSAAGYESWTKPLYVNSPTAKILLTMDEENSANKPNNNSNNQNNTNNSQNKTESESSKTDSSSDDGSKKKQEVELEYLTTIRDTVSSIMNSLSGL